MKLVNVLPQTTTRTPKTLWYVSNAVREQFDTLMQYVENNSEEFEDRQEFRSEYPRSTIVGYIFTDPDQDYRGMGGLGAEVHNAVRQQNINAGKITPAMQDIEPEFAVWRTPQGLTFIEDLLNDPSMVIQISEIALKGILRLCIVAQSKLHANQLAQTDTK